MWKVGWRGVGAVRRPRQAAKRALEMHRDPGSTATVFDVYSGKSGRHTRHDVEETTNTKKARKQ